jgi:hypothetical protein
MKKSYLNLPIMLVAVVALMFSSCKKENGAAQNNINSAVGVASISHAVDLTSADAAAVAEGVGSSQVAGKTSDDGDFGPGHPWERICGSTTVSDGNQPNRTKTIVYDGTTTCHGVIRSGIVTIDNNSGLDWGKVNSQLTVTYINLKVTDVSTGDYHILNGTHTITDLTGGSFTELIDQEVTSGTVTHKNVSSGMTVKYSNGTTRSYNFDRLRTWNLASLVLTETTFADGSNFLQQGVDQDGNNYTDQIASPIIDNNYCTWNPYTGTVIHTVGNNGPTTTTQYGTNAAGVQIGGVQTCANGYTITNSSGKGNKFVSY